MHSASQPIGGKAKKNPVHSEFPPPSPPPFWSLRQTKVRNQKLFNMQIYPIFSLSCILQFLREFKSEHFNQEKPQVNKISYFISLITSSRARLKMRLCRSGRNLHDGQPPSLTSFIDISRLFMRVRCAIIDARSYCLPTFSGQAHRKRRECKVKSYIYAEEDFSFVRLSNKVSYSKLISI